MMFEPDLLTAVPVLFVIIWMHFAPAAWQQRVEQSRPIATMIKLLR